MRSTTSPGRIARRWLPLLLLLPAMAEPLLKNGGFDKELAPWKCGEGKLVPDPDKKGNTLLEVTLDGGVFGLKQPIQWPAGKDSLTLSFRVKSSAASKKSPVQWRMRLCDPRDNSALVAGGTIDESGKWITVTKTIQKPESVVVSILMESNRGEGKIWIDDLKME